MNGQLAFPQKECRAKRASMAVEFLIVFPAFLIMCFFVFELGFWYADKHLLKLATFDAARSLLALQYNSGSISSSCEDAMVFPQLSAQELVDAKSQAMNAAHRELAVKMAYTAPPSTSFLSAVGIQIDPGAYLGIFKQTDAAGSPVLKSIGQLIIRFPSSFALTQIESCQFDLSKNSITVKSRYLRQAKMPLVDRMIWVVFVITKINEAIEKSGFKGVLALELDDFYLGAKPSSAALTELQNQIVAFRHKLKETVSTLHGTSLNLQAASLALGQFPFLDKLAEQSVNYTNNWQNRSHALDQSLTHLQEEIQDSSTLISQQGHVVNALIFAVPSELRLVPMYQTVTLSLAREKNHENWDGVAVGIAPFTHLTFIEGDSNPESSKESDVWMQWTRGMSRNQGEITQ